MKFRACRSCEATRVRIQVVHLYYIWLLNDSFCCSDWPSTGLACGQKASEKASSRRQFLARSSQVQWQKILLWVFHSTFWAFLCISKAPFGLSLWSGHHWKDIFLLQKLSIDGANFGQKWWHQKRKKGQGSSRVVTGGTGVNGLRKNFQVIWSFSVAVIISH